MDQIKNDIRQAQLRAALSVTRELTTLYWRFGKRLSENISEQGWGAKTIDKLSKDIASSFPNVSGFSLRNLNYMRQFAKSYPDENWATAVAQIPWGHNMILMQKVETLEARLWYAEQTIENGWSRSMLTTWIETDLYGRQGKAIHNFQRTLPQHLRKQRLKPCPILGL